MAADPPKQRLLRLLRRTPKDNATRQRSVADESALWSAHERALVRTRDAGAAAQRIASGSARQRAAMDAVADRARALVSRSAEVQASFSRMTEALERLNLVALNAGLEGARLGEAVGRQLGLVSDEVRAQTGRGTDAAREHEAGLRRLNEEVAVLQAQLGDAQTVVTEVSQDSARAAGAATDAESALLDVADRVKRATGSDPEAVRSIAEASERARALVATLSAVGGKVPRALLVAALRPALEPLATILAEGDGGDGSSEVDR
jgi:methyl-accepting chemotaxis protein